MGVSSQRKHQERCSRCQVFSLMPSITDQKMGLEEFAANKIMANVYMFLFLS